MANELLAETQGQTGLTAYFILKDATNQVWNGSAFAAYSTANRNAGAVTATGRADGSYVATMPAAAAGMYCYSLFQQAGASAAESDTLVAGGGVIEWDGSSAVPLSKLKAAVYDSATVSGNVITLSNGATQTIDATTGARTTVG